MSMSRRDFLGSAAGALAKVNRKLGTRRISLSSGFIFHMPNNYIPWGSGRDTEEKQREKMAHPVAPSHY